jgi:voltage-gated sodium channel
LDAQEEWATSWLALKYIKLARTCLYVAEADWFDTYMLSCIALAGIIIGLETYKEFQGDSTLGALDTFVLCSFAFEVLVRTIGEGFTPWRFFTNAQWRWNCFDFCIVFFSIPILPFAAKNVKLLRVVRLLRLTHVFKRIPQLNMIMRGLVDSLSFVSYIVLLWFMILYIYAILGEELFGKNDPWHFRSIEFALVALLQVTCMDVSTTY